MSKTRPDWAMSNTRAFQTVGGPIFTDKINSHELSVVRDHRLDEYNLIILISKFNWIFVTGLFNYKRKG